ncbi:unnamed protein product [Blepharisma stoltei]|uniref:Uncharacterized protein n=1 Tax=Blepharisma stoltei TaxID=1481888 RepID=A0AAU9IVI4_9CILI|nr:unnamed protein product [Blepharisma stoltei]
MWRVILFLSIGVFSLCPTYNCHSGGFDLGNTCAFVTPSKNVLMQICDENNLAPMCMVNPQIFNNFTCGQVPPYTAPLAYPGESCRADSQCRSGQCYQNVCQGQALGYSCISDADCNVGLHCGMGGLCTKQHPYNQECNSDYDCQNGFGCNRTMYASGACLPYYGVQNGEAVGICVDVLGEGNSNLCESGSCMPIYPGTNAEGICQPSFRSAGTYPMTCQVDSDCIGTNGVNKLTGACQCGMDKDGLAYCSAWSGDLPAYTVRSILKQHVNSTAINNCQTMRRFSQSCLAQTLTPPEIYNFTQNNLLAQETARYQGNDDCTQAIFNTRYWGVNTNSFTCKAYSCGTGAQWTNEACIAYQEATNHFALKDCPTGQYCNVAQSQANKWTNATCTTPPTSAPLYPGDPCKVNTDCISGVCSTKGLCVGIGWDNQTTCADDSQCNPGLYCVENANSVLQFTCQPLIKVGQSGCASEFDCVPNANCNFTMNNFPGTCVAYFSAPNGTPVPCAVSGYSSFCQSGACYNAGFSDLGVCAPAPVSQQLPNSCVTSNSCMAMNSLGQTFQGTCTCGYNPTGTSYCSAHIGDAPGKAYLTVAKVLYSSPGMTNCQTSRRHYSDCLDRVAATLGQNTNVYYSAILNFTNYPLYINNDNCVKSIITYDFWTHLPPTPTPPTPPHNDTSSSGILILGLGLFFAFQ